MTKLSELSVSCMLTRIWLTQIIQYYKGLKKGQRAIQTSTPRYHAEPTTVNNQQNVLRQCTVQLQALNINDKRSNQVDPCGRVNTMYKIDHMKLYI